MASATYLINSLALIVVMVVAYRNSQWLGYYAERGCLHRLGARVRVSFSDSFMRNEVVGIVYGLDYTKQVCWCRLGARLRKSSPLALLGGGS